ncbi:MAG: hypothetical protein R2939_10885 [Kofleriaceae bacterium]
MLALATLTSTACGGDDGLGGLPSAGAALPARYQARIAAARALLDDLRARAAEVPSTVEGDADLAGEIEALAVGLTRVDEVIAAWPRAMAAASAPHRRPILARALEGFHAQVGGELATIERLGPHLAARLTAQEARADVERKAAAELAAATFSATCPAGRCSAAPARASSRPRCGAFAIPSARSRRRAGRPATWSSIGSPSVGRAASASTPAARARSCRTWCACSRRSRRSASTSPAPSTAPPPGAARRARRRAEAVVAALVGLGAPSPRIVIRRGPDREPCGGDDDCATGRIAVRIVPP